MSTDLKRRNVPFSPPDMTEAEANEVRDAILLRLDYNRTSNKKVGEACGEICRCER